MASLLVGSLLQTIPATVTTATASTRPNAPSLEKPVKGSDGKVRPRKTDTSPHPATPKTIWPSTGSATFTLPAAVPDAKKGPLAAAGKPGGLPVTLSSATAPTAKSKAPTAPSAASATRQATIQVLDRAAARRAGVDGLLLTVTGAGTTKMPGQAKVTVDYSGFAHAAGANYGSRLRLVQLPACAVTTPDLPECRKVSALVGRNDTETQTVSADTITVPAAATAPTAQFRSATTGLTVLAVTSSASGSTGDYTASPLSVSSTWSTALNSGAFSWNYDMPVPSVPTGLTPKVDLSYSSGAVDGRTSNGNNQASWAGDGFDLSAGFVERSYKPCGDDGVKTNGAEPGDLCWAYDNATISFDGHSGELIPAGTNAWRIKGDDGTKVTRIRDAARGNGAKDGEYFQAITTNGTRYLFGYNRLTNWTTGKPETKSVFTVPVFGDDTGEPCHAATFADSWCQQGWRWNLDQVIDTKGNDITYWYTPETNNYGRNLKASDRTPYVRGGSLHHIEYGQQQADIYSATVKPMAMVNFTPAERCLPDSSPGATCAPAKIDTEPQYWYDTPWDRNCATGTDCDAGRFAPTFFTRTRLSSVTTQTLQADGGYKDIDRWDLHHHWGTADADYQLLLDSIKHTGLTGATPIPLPPITFGYDQRANRLDKTGDGRAPFVKDRLGSIADEAGGQLDINYSAAACNWNALPAPQTNTTHCFPQMYQPDNTTPATTEWFNKYVVDAVIATDRTGGAPDAVTHYTYLDAAAWHFADDEGLTKDKLKTWSQWRGHGHVRVQTGGTSGMSTQADHYFLRGMDGDRTDPTDKTQTRTVTVPDGEGTTLTDDAAWAGFEYRSEAYAAPGGALLSKSANTPWKKETAKRVRDWGTTTANLVGIATTRAFTSLDGGAGASWREVRSNTTRDTYGRTTQVETLGDTTAPTDDRCTRSTYADNTTDWILTGVIHTETVAGTCTATINRDTQADGTSAVLSDTRVRFDGQAYGAAPTKGLPTLTETLKTRNGATASYLDNAATYDGYGRPLTVTTLASTSVFNPANDAAPPVTTAVVNPRTSTTTYTPATGRPTKTTITTPPATIGNAASTQTTTVYTDLVRGLPILTVDTNSRRTEVQYDGLGRTTKVWLPNRSTSNKETPNSEFRYTTLDGAIRSVATLSLNNDSTQDTAYTLYDGLGRERQSQTPAANGGKILTDTFYDERGQAALTYAAYYATGAPSGTLFKVEDATGVETQTAVAFDGLGRPVKTDLLKGNGVGTPLATTTMSYGGDRVTVTPPKGATPTTTISDATGNVTELRQYKSTTPTGAYDATTYGYDRAGHLTQLTDPSNTTWTWIYDQLGRPVKAVDPDSGTSTKTYNDRGELVTSIDGRGKVIANVYDNFSRPLETHDGSATGPLLTSQTWDPAGNKGLSDTTTRYTTVDSTTYPYKNKVTSYDPLGRPKTTMLTVPSIPGQERLSGDYIFGTSYNLDGTIAGTSLPPVGSLPAETIVTTYDKLHRPTTISSNLSGYLGAQSYSLTNKPLQSTYNAGGKTTYVTNGYEFGTQRLHDSRTDLEGDPVAARAATYSYDEAGNVTSLADVSRSGTDRQCFQYDYLARLTESFTPNSTDCPATPNGTALGGPAPYWSSYTYNPDGTRKTETQHDPAGATAKDQTRTYTYPATGAAHPHSLSSTGTLTGGTGTPVTESYAYDSAGNTSERHLNPSPTLTNDQALTWNTENDLAQVLNTVKTKTGSTTVTTTKTTAYVYGPDGSRLTARTIDSANPSGENTTLYLGATELNFVKGATKAKATRYYSLGTATAVRTDDNKVAFQVADHHGTAEVNIDSTTGTATQRHSTPFGAERGTAPTAWAGTKGFLGGTKDTDTGLTHLGAREYDPSTGRFVSVDPLLTAGDPQSLNGYVYSNNNPVTLSDPTGLCVYETDSGPCMPTNGDKGSESLDRTDEGHDPGEVDQSPKTPTTVSVGTFTVSGTAEAVAKAIDKAYSKHAEVFNKNYSSHTWNPTENCMMAIDEDCNKIPWDGSVETVMYRDICGQEGITCSARKSLKQTLLETAAYWAEYEANIEKGLTGIKPKREGLCNSFPAGTLVLLADGTTKPIEKIAIGDKVASADPEMEISGPKEIDATIATPDDTDFSTVTVGGAGGSGTLTVTDHHPMWSPSSQAWIDAGELKAGMTLLSAAGSPLRITSVVHVQKLQSAYNLTVRDLHTYYVLAGTAPVLVHNKGGCLPALRNWNSQRFQFGHENFLLDKKGLEHILVRHHPKYWDGSVKKNQTFFDPSMSVSDVQDAIGEVMRQNRGELIQRGHRGMYQIHGSFNGTNYTLGMNRGRVGQFFPG
ncbi:polymorphic toxin-type HINT domain-containing protein [Streptomyces sp. NPDC006733]|uniref:polymorphic toxin-type HINT domain-containing protein n=1 Tax=Streptomyces sp. NPDC006733 TaxID=3155460 RepID=UPI0034048FDC